MKKYKNKGFTLIELLTVIAILAVILLISIPIILGVLDNARKNSFKNQVLLYVEALKQQTGMALMGSGYSELKSVDNSFYAPTSDSDNKLVRVSISNLNKVMDNVALTNDDDKYFYVEYTDTGYNYYIGEGVRKEGEFSTTCDNTCVTKNYNNEEIRLINFKTFTTNQVVRGDTETTPSEPTTPVTPSGDTTKPEVSVSVEGTTATLILSDDVGIAAYCITETNNSGSCSFVETNETTITRENMTDGTYYAFAKDTSDNISDSESFTISTPLVSGTDGQAVELAGYNWHVIGQDDTKIWLLMDAGQLDNMAHCNTGSSSNCTWSGSYYAYSWQNSLIRTYLNKSTSGGFLYSLPSNVKNKLVETEVCKNPSLSSSDTSSYGGYTKDEIEELQKTYPSITCSGGYTNDKVRLISQSEYFNLTQYSSYSSTATYPYAATGMGNGKGYIPKVSYISRLASNDWLYSSTISNWWTMGTNSSQYANDVQYARYVYINGGLGNSYGEYSYGVRPVIVLQK